jgi:hypothetical protein
MLPRSLDEFLYSHTPCLFFFFFSGIVYLMISMCQRGAMSEKLGSALCFLLLDLDISCDMPAWSCMLLIFVLFHSLRFLGL